MSGIQMERISEGHMTKVDCYLTSLATYHITTICLKSKYTLSAGECFGTDILEHDIFIVFIEDTHNSSEADNDVGR